MTSESNVTSSTSSTHVSSSLLWLPYVTLAVVCISFLAVNFWCYHRRNRLRYRRKAEVLETRERVRERRVILNLVKAKYGTYLVENDADDNRPVEAQLCFANPMRVSGRGTNAQHFPVNSDTKAVVVAILALALAAVVAAFIYRETRGQNKRTELNENTVQDFYPDFFRSPEEQRVFDASFQQSFYFNRKVITPTVNSTRNESCEFVCSGPRPARRKRDQHGVQHGCCRSWVEFHSPTTHPNNNGTVRTLLQYQNKRQWFAVHVCKALIGCNRGCVCSQEDNVAPAVVLKLGVQTAVDLHDTEIDYLVFAGCCKCINT